MKLLEQQFNPELPMDSPISEGELTQLLEQLPGWQVQDHELQREYIFPDFVSALAFTCQIGELAETVDHHPAITTEYGKVKVCWWTHTANGVTLNDLVMAAHTDSRYGKAS